MNAKTSMKKFLEWADDKITVVWSEGCLTQSKSLDHFNPRFDETPDSFLKRVAEWVRNNEIVKGQDGRNEGDVYTFHFFNETLGEEWDEYQEEMFTAEQICDLYDLQGVENNDEKITEEAKQILEKFTGLGYGDTYDEICTYLLKKNGLSRRKI